ncbi:MAG: zinc-dependent alcohol dehydrogenase [Myxococcota bacterium]
MMAMSYRGPSRVRVERKPDPEIEHPNDAILRVTRATICGSDLHLYHGLVPDTRVGSTFGHEFTGVVEEVGPTVRNVKRGDRVVVPFNVFCGSCFFCQRELYACCDSTNPNSSVVGGVYGYSHTTGGYDGGQAQYVRVPFADAGPFKIPDDMGEEDVLFLSDIIPTGYQAAEMGNIRDGDTVVVFGCGPVGVIAARSAWLLGAGRVICVDKVDYRLDFVSRYAHAETLDFRETDDVVLALRRMTEGRGPDVCLDAVGLEASGSVMHKVLGALKLEAGAPTVIEWCINSVRKAGTVVLIGVYGPPWNLVPIGTAMSKGLTLRMAQAHVRRDMPQMLEHVRAGRLDPHPLITHRFPLSAVDEGYHMFAHRQDGMMKCVLYPEA